MLNDGNTAVTLRARAWWERVVDPAVDFLENRVVDPIDSFVTPKVGRYQAHSAHRRVSYARRTLESRAVGCWPWHHATRARLLHAWAGTESSAAHTRRGLHEQHAGMLDSVGCCAPLIQLYKDRAELIRALAVMEEQIAPLWEPVNFGAMPGRIRRIAAEPLAEMSATYSASERAPIAERVINRLRPELGAAVAPLRRLYVD